MTIVFKKERKKKVLRPERHLGSVFLGKHLNLSYNLRNFQSQDSGRDLTHNSNERKLMKLLRDILLS